MISVSRRLVTIQAGNSLHHTCIRDGVTSKRILGGRSLYMKQFSNSSKPHMRVPNNAQFKCIATCPSYTGRSWNIKHFNGYQCRFYSQSAEKTAAKEQSTSLEDEQQSTVGGVPSAESSAVDAKNEEEMEMCDDEEERGAYLTDDQIQELSGGDPEIIKLIKYIQLEFSVLKQDGEQVPSFIRFKFWRELLPLNTKSKRKRFYLYLFKSDMKELSSQRKKEAKREERLKSYAENPMPSREEDPYGMFYGLTRNTLFLRLYDNTVSKFQHSKVANAMMHHPPLILDCSYDEYMTHREAKNCAKQIELLITENRAHAEPFNLYLCNAGRNTKTQHFLRRLIPTIEDDNFAVNIHEESYMDIFPKHRLVYLTPHTRDELEEFNEDDIYIIGGMVDKTDPRPYSLAKAKKHNLTMKRLPLDQHLMWGLGGKSLTLNHMVRILLDLRYTRGDWKTALRHVPMRKLCRDYHPYPDQVQNQSESDETSPHVSPYRKERKSMVLEDFELLNKRKGYRRSDSFSGNSIPRRSNQAIQAPKIKSLLYDDN